jgi:hypothetical protein
LLKAGIVADRRQAQEIFDEIDDMIAKGSSQQITFEMFLAMVKR